MKKYFEVTEDGQVLGVRGKPLATRPDKDGYLRFTANPARVTYKLHREVAKKFIPNPDNKPLVCHRNGKNQDNRVSNLYWGTLKENAADALRHGTIGKGELNGNAKLNNWQRDRIALLSPGFSYRELAEMFGITFGRVGQIVRGAR